MKLSSHRFSLHPWSANYSGSWKWFANRWPVLARTLGPISWSLIWIWAVALALTVHLAFLVAWPDHFVHEDSSAYLSEAEAILNGQYVDDAGKRPYGVALFLVLLSKLFSPHILTFIIAQHVISIGTALLIAVTVRLCGAPRLFALVAFLPAALYARTIHYDNTVGAETISTFLISLAALVAAGVAFRKWPPFLSAAGIGLSLGTVMLCRSAAVGQAVVILLWLAVLVDARWSRRLGVLALAGGVATAVYLIPAAVNSIVGKRPAGNENIAVMSFVVGYSADFDRGVHLDRKARAREVVEKMRTAAGPAGWADAVEYQWPFIVTGLLKETSDSDADLEKVIRDIFIETLTTPSTLYRHVTKHFIREMYFLLFDGNSVARRAPHPQGHEYLVQRDSFPIFHSPTGLKQRRLIYENYAPPARLLWLLPTADRLQAKLDYRFSLGYSPRPDLALLCCGLTISSEYDDYPGPIRWLSAATLILAVVLLAGTIAGRWGLLRPLPGTLAAGGVLMVLLALISAAFPTFLVYGLNRYAYYAIPFLAGATGILGAVLLDRISLCVKGRQ